MSKDLGEEPEEEDESIEETLGWADSLAFPVLGSVALLGLWGLLKYVGKEWINFVLGLYCAYPPFLSSQGKSLISYSLGSRDVFVPGGKLTPQDRAKDQTFGSIIITYLLRKTSYTIPTYHVRIASGLKRWSPALISPVLLTDLTQRSTTSRYPFRPSSSSLLV